MALSWTALQRAPSRSRSTRAAGMVAAVLRAAGVRAAGVRAARVRAAGVLTASCLLLGAYVSAGGSSGRTDEREPEAEPGRGSGGFSVVVISDLNSAYGTTSYGPEVATAVRMIREEWRPDLVLAAGDLIAGQRPSLGDDNVRAMWSAFDSVVGAPLRSAGIPFGFSLGNHDASAYPAHQRDRRFAVEHWRASQRHPGVAFVDSTHFPLYYSFRQGPLFVIAWDATSAIMPQDTTMMRWLQAQLGSDAARRAPFRLVLGHLPLYAVAEGRDRPGEVLESPDSLRALLERHDVHTYISGHHHAYYPGRRGALDLLHTGALGDGPRPLLGAVEPSPRTVTILNFHESAGTVTYSTFAVSGTAVGDSVRLTSLPLRLEGHNGHVVRRDVGQAESRQRGASNSANRGWLRSGFHHQPISRSGFNACCGFTSR
jgi:hypothetical protein